MARVLERVKITPSGRLSLPSDIRRKYGLAGGGEMLIEDRGDEIILRTVSQAVARAQAISQKLLAGRTDAGVAEFLAERHREAERDE